MAGEGAGRCFQDGVRMAFLTYWRRFPGAGAVQIVIDPPDEGGLLGGTPTVFFPAIFPLCRHLPVSLTCGLFLALGAMGRGEGEPFPEKPAQLVADGAAVLLPERAAALNRYLMAGAKEKAITVYVLTVPTLGVPAAGRKARLSELGHRYAEGWLKGALGMVMLFDDESGDAVVIASRETDRRFPPLLRQMALAEPLREIQRGEGLARDKLEGTAMALFTMLGQLREKADAAARRDRRVNYAMGAVVLAGVVLLLLGSRRKPPE